MHDNKAEYGETCKSNRKKRAHLSKTFVFSTHARNRLNLNLNPCPLHPNRTKPMVLDRRKIVSSVPPLRIEFVPRFAFVLRRSVVDTDVVPLRIPPSGADPVPHVASASPRHTFSPAHIHPIPLNLLKEVQKPKPILLEAFDVPNSMNPSSHLTIDTI